MVISSHSFLDGQPIPARHAGDGRNLSPALEWRDVPPGARSLALLVEDPDAPDPAAPRGTHVHWVLYNLPATSPGGLPEGVSRASLPPGTIEGTGDSGRTGYAGPRPPIGRHHYRFRLFALDRRLPEAGPVTGPELRGMMEGHILAEAALVGTAEAPRRHASP